MSHETPEFKDREAKRLQKLYEQILNENPFVHPSSLPDPISITSAKADWALLMENQNGPSDRQNHMKMRIEYNYSIHRNLMSLDESFALIVKKRGGGERVIKSGNWWMDRQTPVGENAEIFERMPYDGRRTIPRNTILAIEK